MIDGRLQGEAGMAGKPRLTRGVQDKPLLLAGVVGTSAAPVVAMGKGAVPGMLSLLGAEMTDPLAWPELSRANTVFSSRRRAADYRTEGNGIARRLEAAGEFPGLYSNIRDAAVTIRNCRDVVLENVHFQDCWPTAILIEHCQRIVIRNCSFAGGTFAIVARGASTRDLVIENCFWQQDDENAPRRIWEEKAGTNSEPIWNKIHWQRIHGDRKDFNYAVDVKHDWRLYDGDFLRTFGIAGNVVVRRCLIRNAFNAIHTFGTETGMLSVPCRNMLVEDNQFVRIRDNTIEPESGAANWVVRHNRFIDNFRPFSVEGQDTGFLYVYGNDGWNIVAPGPGDADRNTGASLFKFTSQTRSDGPFAFFHNSFLLLRDIAKKHGISGLAVANNAIASRAKNSIFGKLWNAPLADSGEDERFTRRWRELGIDFRGNVVHAPGIANDHGLPHYPDMLRIAGYPLANSERGYDPRFAARADEHGQGAIDLRPAEGSPLRGASLPFELRLPDGDCVSVAGGRHVGAWQEGGRFRLDGELPFLDGMFGNVAALTS